MSEVCPNCECYITVPKTWFSTVPPKICGCWKRAIDQELLNRFKKSAEDDWARLHEAFKDMKEVQDKQLKILEIIEENIPKRRHRGGPL